MFDKPQFEVPEAVREMAERNVEQTRAAYAQFMQFAQQAQTMLTRSQGAMAASAIEVQARAMDYARQNLESSFRFASDLARARDVKDYLDIQARYAQSQLQTYTQQAQDLGRMLTEAAQRAQPRP